MSCKNIIVVGNARSIFDQKNGHKIDNFDYVVRMGGYYTRGYEKYVGTKTDLLCNILNNFFRVVKDKNDKFVLCPRACEFTCKHLLFTEFDPDTYIEISNIGNVWGYDGVAIPSAAAGDLYFKKIYKTQNYLRHFIKSEQNDRIFFDFLMESLYNVYSISSITFYSKLLRAKMFAEFNAPFPNQPLSNPSKGMHVINHIINTFINDNIYVTGFDGFKTENYWRNNTERFFESHSPYKEKYMYRKMLNAGVIHEL